MNLSTYGPMSGTLTLLEDLKLFPKHIIRRESSWAIANIADESNLRADWAGVPVDRPAVPKDQVTGTSANLHFLATLLTIPVGVRVAEVVTVLTRTLVTFGSEAADLVEVLLMELVGAR